jgi:hypothetical protein
MIDYWNNNMSDSNEGHGSLGMGLLESALGARQIGEAEQARFESVFFPQILERASLDGTFRPIVGRTPKSLGYDRMMGKAYNTGIYTLILQLNDGRLNFLGQRFTKEGPKLASKPKNPMLGDTASKVAPLNGVVPLPGGFAEAENLAKQLVESKPAEHQKLIEKLQAGEGIAYTLALSFAITKLEGESKDKARLALVERFVRAEMALLRQWLQDDDVEIRRAAALSCIKRKDTSLVPDLIALLDDPEPLVATAAHSVLKSLAGKDFGPKPGSDRVTRSQAVDAWKDWWSKQIKK